MYNLSICILTRNRVNHVRSLLDSLEPALQQCSLACEVILLDNASTEKLSTEETINYQSSFAFRTIIQKSNIGFANNYLAAFYHSDSEWCWVLGDDDIYDFPRILQKLHEIDSNYSTHGREPPSLIHINHSHFFQENERITEVKERVHQIHADLLLCEKDFLNLVSNSIGGLLFVSSNIFKLSSLRNRLKSKYLVTYASSCICLAVPLIAIRNSNIFVISNPLIKDRLRGSWSMDAAPEIVFRLDLPCSIYASKNPLAIQALIPSYRLRSIVKAMIVGLYNRDLQKTTYFIMKTLWIWLGNHSSLLRH